MNTSEDLHLAARRHHVDGELNRLTNRHGKDLTIARAVVRPVRARVVAVERAVGIAVANFADAVTTKVVV